MAAKQNNAQLGDSREHNTANIENIHTNYPTNERWIVGRSELGHPVDNNPPQSKKTLVAYKVKFAIVCCGSHRTTPKAVKKQSTMSKGASNTDCIFRWIAKLSSMEAMQDPEKAISSIMPPP